MSNNRKCWMCGADAGPYPGNGPRSVRCESCRKEAGVRSKRQARSEPVACVECGGMHVGLSRRCNACCQKRKRARKAAGLAGNNGTGRGMKLTATEIKKRAEFTGYYVDDDTGELVVMAQSANGKWVETERKPAPKDLALTHFFGRHTKGRLLPVYRI